MERVEVSRHFDARPAAVWEVYTDHARWQEWAGVGRSRLVRAGSPDPNGCGALRAVGPPGLAAREEVLEFEPPERMTYRLIGGGLPLRNHRGEVCFAPEGDGTRVTWRCRFEPRIPGTGALLRHLITAVFRRALEGLARERIPDRP